MWKLHPYVLTIHSLLRWLVFGSLILALFHSLASLYTNGRFTRFSRRLKALCVAFTNTQFLVGLVLYALSPLVRYFLSNFSQAIHEREVRFFGMEHITVMFIAVALINVGAGGIEGQKTDREKFKAMAVWFGIALFLIVTSIPWKFSPLISRPYFRWF